MYIENLDHYVELYHLEPNIFEYIYNFNRKIAFVENKYIDQALSAKHVIIRFFSNVGFMERKLDKDLCEFNVVEMQNLFVILGIATQATFDNRKTIVRQYFDWCVSENLIKLQQMTWFKEFHFEDMPLTI